VENDLELESKPEMKGLSDQSGNTRISIFNVTLFMNVTKVNANMKQVKGPKEKLKFCFDFRISVLHYSLLPFL